MNQESGDHGIRVRLHESTRDDDSAAGAVDSSLFPEWPHRSGHDVRNKLSRRENATFHRAWLAELDGNTVGRMVVSSSWWHDRSDPVYVTLNVHRDFQGRGVGTVLWARLAHALAPHPSTEISLMVRDDDARSMDIVHRLGFTPKMTLIYSSLDLTSGVTEEALALIDRLRAQGYRFLDGECIRDRYPENWRERWWRLHVSIAKDVPSVEPHDELPFDTFQRLVLESSEFVPRNWMIGVYEDQWIGLSGLRGFQGVDTVAAVSLTGVLRAHRRQGVATALKAESANAARSRGFKTILTDNEENNPMWTLNRRLGFVQIFSGSMYRGPQPKVVVQ